MMISKLITYSRWGGPITITGLFLIMVAYQSPNGTVLGRYSPHFFQLIMATGVWVAVCWWVAINDLRFNCLMAHFKQLGFWCWVIVVVCFIILTDLFIDLISLFAIVPFIIASVMVWLVYSPILPNQHLSNTHQQASERSIIAAMVMVSLVAGVVVVELIFRTLLVQDYVPTSSTEFEQLVTSKWPRAINPIKEPGTIRILGLSDSFGQAGGRDNYHYQLEELAQTANFPVEMVNFSVRGYEPYEQLQLLRQFGAQYQPDIVLHGFFVGNDFETPKGIFKSYLNIPIRPPTGLVAYRPNNFLLMIWLRRYITAYNQTLAQPQLINLTTTKQTTIKPTSHLMITSTEILSSPTNIQSEKATFSEEAFLEIEYERLQISRPTTDPLARWSQTAALLDDIRAEVEELGGKYVMVIHPDQYQIEEPLRQQLATHYQLDMADYDLTLPQRFLLNYCATHQLLCLDLLPSFVEQGKQGGLYLLQDTHYNDQGNRLASETIFDFLQKNEVITP